MFQIYQEEVIEERHRHRYEVNPKYHDVFKNSDMVFSAFDESRTLVEAIELRNHPFFVGVQYHPEFLSRPLKPRPLFEAFLKSMITPL
jgi:CTP synthase